jgi:pyruvate ferredoxin oxidoreductase gamma subunit
MYAIRFHGRGGQGMKTASRLLGRALFIAGFEVQDAPVYGAERRGAPMAAYVRADREAIRQRGIIRNPGLVVVADDSLVPIPAAGVLAGIGPHTVLLIVSHVSDEIWRFRLNLAGPIIILSPPADADYGRMPLLSPACAGAAAALCGVVGKDHLLQAIEIELHSFGDVALRANRDAAVQAFDAMQASNVTMQQTQPADPNNYRKPAWINLPLETAPLSAPAIEGALTSVEVRTGLWRTQRPVIDYTLCHHCTWVCGEFCPDGVISVRADGAPEIDYEHCKGCMICVAQCPSHAITAIPEAEARQRESGVH